ncbi:hypothetical protein HBI79_102010 [Parastagonospora nodorum]|nr:hypothetical protein HBI79_102010 [Parastagonospora nodorum]KAH5457120.1 hypothetical protein HBI47_000620 [Parastagonospora nodorum]
MTLKTPLAEDRSAQEAVHEQQHETLKPRLTRERGTIQDRNARRSPLLRLPAELREQIWLYAFGSRAIHPRLYYAYAQTTNTRTTMRLCCSFASCKELFTDEEVNRQAIVVGSKRWMIAKTQALSTGTFIGSHSSCAKNSEMIYTIVPGVCKQIYYEAVPNAWKTCTFTFDSDIDFQHFFKSSIIPFDLITKLSIVLNNKKRRLGWQIGLEKSGLIAQLESLKGLNIVQVHAYGRTPSVMHLADSFKQFRLREDQVTVTAYPFSNPHEGRMSDLEERVREHLFNTKDVQQRI